MKLFSYIGLFVGLTLTCLASPVWASKNPPEELQMIARQAHANDPGAQLLLGIAYLEGRYGVRIDEKKATHWLHQSARDGNAYAALLLGSCYAKGRGVKRDDALAVAWWKKAARANNAKAEYLLGKARLEGKGIPKNPARAMYWLKRSADEGNGDAEYLIGRMYHEGYAVAQDKRSAKDWLARAAARGNIKALNLLGVLKDIVDSGTLTYEESAENLKERAKHGDPVAAYELGLRYESGAWDVPSDQHKALSWIRKAADSGNHVAMKTLVEIYERGELGEKPNPQKAHQWATKAARYK